MDLQLTGKRALVTGSTKGIGKAIAQALAAEGATVLVNGRNEEEVAQLARELGGEACPGDVSDGPGCDAVARRAQSGGPVDILVNNTGIFQPTPFGEIDDATWERFYQVNVMSGIRLSRTLLPAMQERGWGRIVFISSESALNIDPNMIHYCMTKTAQLSVARGLAKLCQGTQVTVNSVLPGPTWTEGVSDFVGQVAEAQGTDKESMREDFVAQNRGSSITQRFADPREVGHMVAFVCSPLASSTTGAALRCEGGIVDVCF